MANLAIKGHLTRGKDVIEILEMFGGMNLKKLEGTDHKYYYSIDNDGTILGIISVYNHVCYTIEEFEEKYPYKVGDKVYYDNKVCDIIEMLWNNNLNTISYGIHNGKIKNLAIVEELQPYKEETMEEKIQAYEVTEEICANEIAIEFDPSKFEMIERNGKYFVVKKQPQYPKTYKECCGVLKIPKNEHYIDIDAPLVPSDYNRLVSAFTKLLICRDAYWWIAGEEMGLGKPWKPDYHEKSYEQGSPIKYVIYYTGTYITKEQKCTPSYILAFPTAEMRDAFFENFKELIEIVKELL